MISVEVETNAINGYEKLIEIERSPMEKSEMGLRLNQPESLEISIKIFECKLMKRKMILFKTLNIF